VGVVWCVGIFSLTLNPVITVITVWTRWTPCTGRT
jgi:hypothetical protein